MVSVMPTVDLGSSVSARAAAATVGATPPAEPSAAAGCSPYQPPSPAALGAVLAACRPGVLPVEACRLMLHSLGDCLTGPEQQQVLRSAQQQQQGASVAAATHAGPKRGREEFDEQQQLVQAEGGFAGVTADDAGFNGPSAKRCGVAEPEQQQRQQQCAIEQGLVALPPGVSPGYMCALACLGLDVKTLLMTA